MLTLVALILIGVYMAVFATQNFTPVSVTIANVTFNSLPLYLVVFASLLLGVLLSALISFIDAVSSVFVLHGKDSAINEAKNTIVELKKEKRELELENAHLKGERHPKAVVLDENDSRYKEGEHPTFLQRIRHSFS